MMTFSAFASVFPLEAAWLVFGYCCGRGYSVWRCLGGSVLVFLAAQGLMTSIAVLW